MNFCRLLMTHECVFLTSDSIGGSPPASRTKTLKSGFSLRRPATIHPAAPAPTTMKSKVSGEKHFLLEESNSE